MARGNGATARASTTPAGLFPTSLCRRSGNLFPPLGGHTFGSRLSALAPECHGSRVLALLGRAPHDVDGVVCAAISAFESFSLGAGWGGTLLCAPAVRLWSALRRST